MLKDIRRDLRELADPGKAKLLMRFFKTGKGEYGEGDIFLGIMVPEQRQVAKKYAHDVTLDDLAKLLKSKYHEERLVALLVLVKKYQQNESLNFKSSIFKFYLSHAKYINNWDLVDLSAPKIVGAYLEGKPKGILYKPAKSKNLWERRIAILSTFHDIYYGKLDDGLKISAMLLKDKHDLIHKATGWMLRETGKRCGQHHLTNFLDKHHKQMPRTMLRYAIERLPEKLKVRYLL